MNGPMRIRTYRDEDGRLWVGQGRALPIRRNQEPRFHLVLSFFWAIAFWALLALCTVSS
jgi:hypothetical protein